MIRIIFEGLMLGLSVGGYCVGACFVFLMPYLLVEGRRLAFENLMKIFLFMLGRLIAYIGFALIMGFIGMKHPDIFTAKFSQWSLILASLLMLIYALTHNFADAKFCRPFIHRFSLMRIPFFLGFLTGISPCPPFLVGLARILTLHSVLMGVVLFVAFFLGTSAYVIPLVFVSYLNRSERIKQIGLIVALLSSLWFLFVGIAGIIK